MLIYFLLSEFFGGERSVCVKMVYKWKYASLFIFAMHFEIFFSYVRKRLDNRAHRLN